MMTRLSSGRHVVAALSCEPKHLSAESGGPGQPQSLPTVIAPSLFPATLRRHGWLMLAVVAALLTIGFRLGGLPLINPDEGRNAEVAREMKEQGSRGLQPQAWRE